MNVFIKSTAQSHACMDSVMTGKGGTQSNVFIKSNVQSNACIGSAMTGKGGTKSNVITRVIMLLLLMLGVGGQMWAATEIAYTMNCPKNTSNNSYANYYSVTINSVEWYAPGNQSWDGFWGIGGKSLSTDTNRYLYTKTAISDAITSIEVNHGGLSASNKPTVNSLTLDVYSTAAKAAAGGTGDISHELKSSPVTDGTVTFTLPAGKSWEGRFFRFTYSIKQANKSNGYIKLESIVFNKETGSTLINPDLSWNGSAPSNKLIGDTYTRTATTTSDALVTYSSNATSVATVNATTGEVTAAGAGTATITASVAATTTYSAKSITYEVTVVKPDIATISSITPSKTSMLIGETGTTSVLATIYNNLEDASDKYDRKFSSSTPSAVTVDASGAYVAVAEGSATITVTYEPKPAYANRYNTVTKTSSTITVTKPNVVTLSGSLTPNPLSIGDSGSFSGLTFTPYSGLTASDYTVSYETSNASKLTVTSAGTYNAIAAGSVTVTVTVTPNNSTKYATVSQNYTVTIMAPAADGDYIKVTSEPADWTGTYLIVYEDGAVAMNGGLTTLDIAENTIGVTIADDRIPENAANDAASFNISSDGDGGWTILSRSGLYIGQTANDNGLRTSSEIISNGLSLSGTDAVISCGTTTLRYNYAVDQQRFRYYKSGQQPVALYKRKVALKNATTAEFVTSSKKLTVGQEWTNTLTTNNTTGAQTFTSSNPAIASVDSETGEVTANAVGGPVTITVNIAETATHLAGSASYTVYVLASSTRYYRAVTTTAEIDAGIAAGKKFLIATPHTGTYYAMGAISGNVGGTTVVPTENDGGILYLKVDADLVDEVNEFTLAKSSDVYTFYQSLDEKYLSYEATSSNNIYTSATADANAQKFSLTYADDAWAIESQGTAGRYLQYNYNNGSPRYCCYTTQTNPMIFMEGKAVATIGDDFSPTELLIGENETLAVTITPASGLSASDYTMTWTASNTKMTVNNASTGAVTGVSTGDVDVTLMITPVDASTYSPIVKTFTISVVETIIPGESNYVLVESAPTDWSGKYLIVYNNRYALNSHNGNKNANTYATYTDISSYYSSKKIASNSTTDALQITIAKTTHGYSLYDEGANDKAYLGYNSSSNGSYLRWDGTYTANQDEWTLGVNSIVSVYNSAKAIRWNNSSPRFAIYATDGQQSVQLYKLVTTPTQYNFKVYAGSSDYTIEKVTTAAPTLTENQVAVINLEPAQVATMPEAIKNADRVVINGEAASIVVTDKQAGVSTNNGYTNFYAPAAFTTTSKVSYTRSGVSGFNSVCLPFSYTVAQACSASMFGTDAEIYVLGSVTDGAVNFVKMTSGTVAAGTPVIVKTSTTTSWNINELSGTFAVNGVAPVEDPKSDGSRKATLKGAYQTLTINTGDASENGHSYYKLNADGTYFVKVPANAKVYPFRVYLDVETLGSTPAPSKLSFNLIDGGSIVMDPSVSIADVTTLVNMLLGKGNVTTTGDGVHYIRPTDGEQISADWDGDGQVTISDVTKLVNKVLKK